MLQHSLPEKNKAADRGETQGSTDARVAQALAVSALPPWALWKPL